MPELLEEFRKAGCLPDAVAVKHDLAGTLGSMDGRHDARRGATIFLKDERMSERDEKSAKNAEKAEKQAQRAAERAAKAEEKREEGKELGKKLAEDVKAALAKQAEQAGQVEVDGMDVDGGEIALSEDAQEREHAPSADVEEKVLAALADLAVELYRFEQRKPHHCRSFRAQ